MGVLTIHTDGTDYRILPTTRSHTPCGNGELAGEPSQFSLAVRAESRGVGDRNDLVVDIGRTHARTTVSLNDGYTKTASHISI